MAYIRPHRNLYSIKDLGYSIYYYIKACIKGISIFKIQNYYVKRDDLVLKN